MMEALFGLEIYIWEATIPPHCNYDYYFQVLWLWGGRLITLSLSFLFKNGGNTCSVYSIEFNNIYVKVLRKMVYKCWFLYAFVNQKNILFAI